MPDFGQLFALLWPPWDWCRPLKYQDEPYFLNYARTVSAKAGKFVKASNWVEIDRITGALIK